MRIFKPKSAESWTRERLFTEKYDWMLGCALRLVNGDREAAEDLVQESFLQFILAKMELKSTENIEPLLYTNLKFVHLAYLRRLQRYPSEPLPLAQYDFLELALRANSSVADRVEVQNTLRRIVAYVCWRKEYAKSASLMVLRYFHAYYPDEIVRIAQTTRHAVDIQLQEGRQEASLYASSPGKLKIIRQAESLELEPDYSAVPSEQLVPELRKTIFAARRTECLPEDALHKRYQKKTAIPRELLAHIVSCERCLGLANSFCGVTPPTDRYLEETLGRDQTSRGKSKKDTSMSSDIGRALRLVQQRFRDVYEHAPHQLNIVVNGVVLATQDVSSTWNRQEVRLNPDVKPEYIQVISEQDICLLAMHVDSAAAEVQQEIHHEIDLSNGRQIRARLRFTSVGVLVQVAYYAPQEEVVAESECEPDEMDAADSAECASTPQEHADENVSCPPWWTKLWPKVPRLRFPEINPVFAIATSLALVVVALIALWPKGVFKPNPNDLLAHAIAAHTEGTAAAQPGVIRQKVRIRTSKRTVERTIYRDAQGRRQLKAQTLNADDAQLQARLSTANVVWDNPLSAVNYKVWHDSGLITHDQVTRSGDGMLTLTTTATSGAVARESLTIRERDFHAVDRTIEFRDSDTIDIAEVDYSIVPWGPVTEPLFDRASGSAALVPQTPQVLVPLTQAELDEAELRARLALNLLHADTDLHVQITRTGAGVRVRAVVEDVARKRVMEARLRSLPNVVAEIYTFGEMARAPQPKAPSKIHLYESVAESSPIQHYLAAKGWAPDRAADLSSQILNVSVVVYSESKTLDDLSRRFGPPNQLADSAANLLDQLIGNHTAALMTALGREDALLAEAGLSSVSTSAAVISSAAPLADLGQRNRALCERLALTEAGTEENTSPEFIAPELRQSIVQTRAAASRMSAALDNLHRFNAAR